jgi:hypothetical protein
MVVNNPTHGSKPFSFEEPTMKLVKRKETTAVIEAPAVEDKDTSTIATLRDRELQRQAELDSEWRTTVFRLAAGEEVDPDVVNELVVSTRKSVDLLQQDVDIATAILKARAIASDENRRRIEKLGKQFQQANQEHADAEKRLREEERRLFRLAQSLYAQFNDGRTQLMLSESDLGRIRKCHPHLFDSQDSEPSK